MHFIEPSRLARKDYLQISVFLNLIIVKQEEVTYVLQKKAIRGAINKVMRSWLAGRSQT